MATGPPTYLFGLDGSFSSYHKLPIGLIHTKVKTRVNREWSVLEHRYNNRGVSKVEVTGLVVNLQHREGRASLTVDDGTGTIRAVRFFRREADSDGAAFGDDFNTRGTDANPPQYTNDVSSLRLGDLVTVRGALVKHETNWHEYAFGLKASSVQLLGGPNLEMLSWTSCMVLHREVYLQGPDQSDALLGALRLLGGRGSSSDPFLYCVCCDDAATAAVKAALWACKCGFSPCAADSRGALRLALLHRLLDRGAFTAQALLQEDRALVEGLARSGEALANGIYYVPGSAAATASSSGALLEELLLALQADGLLLRQGSGYRVADMPSLGALLARAVEDLSILNPFYYYSSEDRVHCLREEESRRAVLQRVQQQHPAVSRARWERCYEAYVVAAEE